MKKSFYKYIVIGIIAVIGTVGYNINFHLGNSDYQIIMSNVEALARGEGGGVDFVTVDCGNSEYPPCQVTCPACRKLYSSPSDRRAPLQHVFGSCSCGHRF